MKRITAILFSFFYLSISIGLTVNLHYCHGELSSVVIDSELNSCSCGHESDSSCCQNDSKVIVFNVEQTVTPDLRISNEIPSFDLFTSLSIFLEKTLDVDNVPYAFKDKSPPPQQPIWLQNCSLVYYG